MGARLCSIFPVFINHPRRASERARERASAKSTERGHSGGGGHGEGETWATSLCDSLVCTIYGEQQP